MSSGSNQLHNTRGVGGQYPHGTHVEGPKVAPRVQKALGERSCRRDLDQSLH